MNRRDFLKQPALALAASSLESLSQASGAEPAKKPVPFIDTHQHLWDLSKFKLPWLKEGSVLARSYVMADYLKATEGLGLAKSVYMEVAVDPSQLDQEAEYVIDICKKGNTPMVGAIIGGRPAADNFKQYASKFRDHKHVKGIRQVLHEDGTPPGTCLEAKYIQGIRLLGELGLSFDLCMRAAEIPDAAKLIDACPDTRFILDHCGNANVQAKDRSQWQKDMADIAKRKNLACKVSGIVASAKPGAWSADDLAPIIRHTVEVFGKDRIVFGGDWPVCTLAATYKQWVEALRSIVADWKEEDQRKLFHDNAIRVYRLG